MSFYYVSDYVAFSTVFLVEHIKEAEVSRPK